MEHSIKCEERERESPRQTEKSELYTLVYTHLSLCNILSNYKEKSQFFLFNITD